MENIPRIKVVLVGDGGVGKTSLLQRFRNEQFNPRYFPTMGVEIQPLQFQTNKGPVIVDVWDTAGQERLGDLKSAYYRGAQAAILVFDMTSQLSYRHLDTWYNAVTDVCGDDLFTVVCGTKADTQRLHVDPQIPYHPTSARTGHNIQHPFLDIIQNQLGNDTRLAVRQ